MNKPISVVLSTDSNFVQHLAVTITSILDTYHSDRELNIFVLNTGIANESKNILTALANELCNQVNVVFIEPDIDLIKNARVDGHITLASYLRLLIPEVLPGGITQVVYLDSDTIVRESIHHLFDFPLGNYAIGAVGEPTPHHMIGRGFDASNGYFNSGVLLLNTCALRRENATEKLVALVAREGQELQFHDQDALNLHFRCNWQRLPLKWNVYSSLFKKRRSEQSETIRMALERPAIVHFTTTFKPWHYSLRHPYKGLYFKYLDCTPWKGNACIDRTPIKAVRKLAATVRDRVTNRLSHDPVGI